METPSENNQKLTPQVSNAPPQSQIKTMILSSCLGSIITVIIISFLLRNTSFVNIYLPSTSIKNANSDSSSEGKDTELEMQRRGYADNVHLIVLENAVGKGAVCLDGSPPGYYFREGRGGGKDSWIIHFFGGAWCFDEEACLQRSKTVLGSSDYFPAHPPKLQGILSDDPKNNPDFYDWNLVMLCYCDGASFSGYRMEPINVNGEYIYMRGKKILEFIIEELLQSQLRKADKVLLSGTSAGGLAVVIHADYIRSKLPQSISLRAVADSGYFVDIASLNGGNMINRHFKRMFEIHNSAIGVDEDCVRDAHPRYRWKCIFPQHTFRFVKTPIFILQSAYDAWQMIHIRGINCQVPEYNENQRRRKSWVNHVVKRSAPTTKPARPDHTWAYKHIHGIYCKPPECTGREMRGLLLYRNITLHAMRPVLQSRTSGLLLTSCMEHSQSLYDDTWTRLYVNGFSVAQLIGNWCFGRTTTHHHVDCEYPCNPTCSNVW